MVSFQVTNLKNLKDQDCRIFNCSDNRICQDDGYCICQNGFNEVNCSRWSLQGEDFFNIDQNLFFFLRNF